MNAVYTAPTNLGGTVTITATSGSISGSANVTVNCGQPAAPATAPAAPQPTISAPRTGTGTSSITPPNTGDAGLAGAMAWQGYAGIGLIVVSLVSAFALVRPRQQQ